jgi:hypothetical protein
MTSINEEEIVDRLEQTIKNLLDQQIKLAADGIEPHLIAGAFLALGIDRFTAVMGERHAAHVLERAAADMLHKAKPLH